MITGKWIMQDADTKHNGYEGWDTYAIRDAKTNVCLALVGEIDRYHAQEYRDIAQAISAVPDMIEALQNLISYLESNYDHNEIAMQECDKALLALAKAGIK
jgi:hypothetical protein